MKKVLIVTGIVIGILVVPFLGMTISPTRELIMGLAPDEAVLQLADKIDKSRAENESKIQELKVMNYEQQNKIQELQSLTEEQRAQFENQKSESAKQQINTEKKQDNVSNCLEVNELFTNIPSKPSGGCSRMGPNNIVDMYKEIKDGYEEAKDKDDEISEKCFKKYLDVLEPAYNKYLEAKKLCL
ncbi:MAG: hypothetical protein UR66_C0008G0021 [Candidatus Moranbacteria bacterium GW2011_GWE1_35_17]|nr:MAG: hypothetical protein UR66_C0008G0021 [Candidatus Moranbacteria bacterium GW2011_GWE1_35_17]KKP71595.1 MAG: hypothetical protein UR65_C0030G0004 [Candidatus Moranbacteria bacterium GW2011_GWE2_35_164]KKP80783.1 MAG: hypothetical protein UR82_C0082G0004 [Candidatus Moranbacteria bacterium GW2011_GWF1_35_5]KKP84294.1 MAG: hypothetical protein UR83_C0024G0023 [Candidatus Moranbacteria bacterium GW2011_GWF2_35_54]